MITSPYPMTAWPVLESDETRASHNSTVKSLGTLPWVFSTQQRSTPPRHPGSGGSQERPLLPLPPPRGLGGHDSQRWHGGVAFTRSRVILIWILTRVQIPALAVRLFSVSHSKDYTPDSSLHFQPPVSHLLLSLVCTTLSSRHYDHFREEKTPLC